MPVPTFSACVPVYEVYDCARVRGSVNEHVHEQTKYRRRNGDFTDDTPYIICPHHIYKHTCMVIKDESCHLFFFPGNAFLQAVGIAGGNQLHIVWQHYAVHASVTHHLFKQSHAVAGVYLIQEHY